MGQGDPGCEPETQLTDINPMRPAKGTIPGTSAFKRKTKPIFHWS